MPANIYAPESVLDEVATRVGLVVGAAKGGNPVLEGEGTKGKSRSSQRQKSAWGEGPRRPLPRPDLAATGRTPPSPRTESSPIPAQTRAAARQNKVGAQIAMTSSVQRWAASVRQTEERLWTSTFMWQ